MERQINIPHLPKVCEQYDIEIAELEKQLGMTKDINQIKLILKEITLIEATMKRFGCK